MSETKLGPNPEVFDVWMRERDQVVEQILNVLLPNSKEKAMSEEKVMRCKLVLHDLFPNYKWKLDSEGKLMRDERGNCVPDTEHMESGRVRFGGVWEGSTEKQAMSENAVFGKATPHAEFVATIYNTHVLGSLVPGKKYYVDFTPAPD